MHGLHLTADLHGCAADHPPLTDAGRLRTLCLAAVQRAGLRAVGELFHRYAPAVTGSGPVQAAGVTGVVLLAESHLAVHTWPELGAVTLDVYVCNVGADNSAGAHRVLEQLIDDFAPRSVERQALQRGRLSA